MATVPDDAYPLLLDLGGRPARGVSEALPEALPRRDGRNRHAIAEGRTVATNVLD